MVKLRACVDFWGEWLSTLLDLEIKKAIPVGHADNSCTALLDRGRTQYACWPCRCGHQRRVPAKVFHQLEFVSSLEWIRGHDPAIVRVLATGRKRQTRDIAKTLSVARPPFLMVFVLRSFQYAEVEYLGYDNVCYRK